MAQTGAVFTASSTLDLLVLDKGEPVEDALISIEGDVAMTDADGRLSTETESLRVTDTGQHGAASKRSRSNETTSRISSLGTPIAR